MTKDEMFDWIVENASYIMIDDDGWIVMTHKVEISTDGPTLSQCVEELMKMQQASEQK